MISRKSNESNFEYALRLVDYKMENPKEIDWQDIVDMANLDVSAETLRKSVQTTLGGYNVMKHYQDIIQKAAFSHEEELQKLEEKKREILIERKKLQSDKHTINRFISQKGKRDAYMESILDAINRLDTPKFEEVPTEDSEKAYILQFSDVHYGSTFKSITNEYSREIARERINRMLCETKNFVKRNDVKEIYVVNNADSLQGMLRMSDLKMNDIPVVDSVIEFSKLISEFLNELSKVCHVKYYQVQMANHTELRLLNAKAGSMACEDMEKIIVNFIKESLKDNDRVFVNTDFTGDNLQFDLLGFQFIALHGHTIRNVEKAIKDKSDLYKKFFDYMLIGHYHSSFEKCVGEKENNSIEILCSPSFVGSCPYSDKLSLGSKASCKIYTFEKDKGHTESKTIILN